MSKHEELMRVLIEEAPNEDWDNDSLSNSVNRIVACLMEVDEGMKKAAEQACLDDKSFPSSGVLAVRAALQSVRRET